MAFNKNYDTLCVGIVITYYEKETEIRLFMFLYTVHSHMVVLTEIYITKT